MSSRSPVCLSRLRNRGRRAAWGSIRRGADHARMADRRACQSNPVAAEQDRLTISGPVHASTGLSADAGPRSCSNASSTRRVARRLVVHSALMAAALKPRLGAWRCASASAASSISRSRGGRDRGQLSSISLTEGRTAFALGDVGRIICTPPRRRTVLTQGDLGFADVSPRGVALGRRRSRWRCRASARAAECRLKLRRAWAPRDLIGAGLSRPRYACAENLPGGARDPRSPAGPSRRSAIASAKRWTPTAWSGCSRGIESGAIHVIARAILRNPRRSPWKCLVGRVPMLISTNAAPLEERRTQGG